MFVYNRTQTFTPSYSSKRNEGICTQKELFKNSLATLFIMAQNRVLLKGEYIKKLFYTHTNEYYTIIKRNESLILKAK